MYKVTFAKNVWDGESEGSASRFAMVSLSMDLEFVPFLGLRVSLLGGRTSGVIAVNWSSSDNSFLCDLEDQFLEFDCGGWDEVLSRKNEHGWTLVGVFDNEE